MSKTSINTKTVLTITDMTESTELLALKRQKEGYKVIKSLLNVKLSRKLILHTVASSLLTGTRLYEFSRYLEYYP